MARLSRGKRGVSPPPSVEVGKSLILLECIKITLYYLVCFSMTSTSTKIRRSGRSERFTSTQFDHFDGFFQKSIYMIIKYINIIKIERN
jgi:hypothetical protein